MAGMIFAEADDMVSMIDAAVVMPTVDVSVNNVKDGLSALIDSGRVDLPPVTRVPLADRYARRLLYRSPEHGYTVIAMTWGPGQGTPLHDHSGMWCVEGVWRGEIAVTQYDLVDEGDDTFRFREEGCVRATAGSAGCLIPPFEYHTIKNASQDELAVTIHIYGGEMETCSIFLPENDGWFRRQTREMSYDA